MNNFNVKKIIHVFVLAVIKNIATRAQTVFPLVLSCVLLSPSFQLQAELIETVHLTPTDNSYLTNITDDPLRPAWTYPENDAQGDGHDIWTIDTTAFDTNYYIDIVLGIQDSGWHPDNHRVFWNDIVLGETGAGTRGEWSFQALAELHTIELQWLNPIPGGAWYQIDITATQGALIQNVSEANAIVLLCLGLFSIAYVRRNVLLGSNSPEYE